MKKTILTVTLLLIMATLTMAQSQKAVRITSDLANIRQMASTDSPIILTVRKDTLLPYLGKNGNWLRVETPDGKTSGYVHSSIAEVVDAPAGLIRQEAKTVQEAERSATKKEKAAEKKPREQTAPPRIKRQTASKKFYLSGLYSLAMQEEKKDVGFTTAIYYEDAAFNSSYQMDKGNGFAVALGYRFASSLAIELGADITTRNMSITSTFSIPHPLWVGNNRGGEVSHTGEISENSVFANLAYHFSLSPLTVQLSAGPCMVMAEADIVEDFQYTESAYPFSTVSVSQSIIREKQNVFGFNAGIGIGYQFGNSFAIIANIRYISAKMKISGDGQDLTYPSEITLGGLKAGGGIQISF